MNTQNRLSSKTRTFWIIDFLLAISALLAGLSGVYFLYFVSGGYQGGRNPLYGVTLFFDRTTWDLLHTWGGVAMIAAAVIHITLHWNWFVSMISRTIKGISGKISCLNRNAQRNFWLNIITGLSFLVTAVSGMYFQFFPGGSNGTPDPSVLFNRTTWDIIHTWSGVSLMITAMIHFTIHWKWILNVTKKMLRLIPSQEVVTTSELEGAR